MSMNYQIQLLKGVNHTSSELAPIALEPLFWRFYYAYSLDAINVIQGGEHVFLDLGPAPAGLVETGNAEDVLVGEGPDWRHVRNWHGIRKDWRAVSPDEARGRRSAWR